MIGAPTIDSREGDRRQKALKSALQRSVQQRSGMSRFSRSGLGRGSVAGFGRRPVSSGGRPSGILSFLTNKGPQGFQGGLASYLGRSGGLGQLVQSTQLPSAPLPGVGGGGGGSVGLPAGGGGGGGGGSSFLPSGDSPDFGTTSGGGDYTINDPYMQPVPAGEPDLMAESGYIPLGGGLYIDPSTGSLYTGSGMSMGAYGLQGTMPSGTGLQE